MILHNSLQPNVAQNTKPLQHTELVYIYDTYSPMMYGTILKMTGDTRMADIILEDIFIDLHKKETILPHHIPFSHVLLRHTFKSTLKHLEAVGQKINASFNALYPLINQFYFEQKTLKEVALALVMTEQEVLKSLRAEFNHFCNK